MVRSFALIMLSVSLFIFFACSEDSSPTKNDKPTVVFVGVLYDSILNVSMSYSPFAYDSSRYKYTLNSDNTFKVDMKVSASLPWTLTPSEEGTYTINGTTYTFTPVINRRDSNGTNVLTDTLRLAYTATLSNDSLTITNFANIGNKNKQRNLKTLILKKQ